MFLKGDKSGYPDKCIEFVCNETAAAQSEKCINSSEMVILKCVWQDANFVKQINKLDFWVFIIVKMNE